MRRISSAAPGRPALARLGLVLLLALVVSGFSDTPARAFSSSPHEAAKIGLPGGDDLRASVLYLNSYHHGYAWSDNIVEGIRDELDPHVGIDLQVEYMDFKKYELEHVRPLLVDLYARKFRDKRFSLVMVSDNNAFDFILDYGDSLFPGVPVVFCGVNDFDSARIAERAITGVVENYDVGDTLRLALRLHPEKRRLVVIGDRSRTGLAILNQVRRAAAQLPGNIEVEAWTKYDLEEVRSRVRKTPADTFYFFIPFYQIIGGRYSSAQEVLELVHATTTAPIYSSWVFLLGHGLVGGKLISGREHGRRAARMALQVLGGTSLAQVPVQTGAETHYEFDYNELRRQHIEYEQLPPAASS